MSGPSSAPRQRVSSARGRRKMAESDQRPIDLVDDVDDHEQAEDLNFRVRDHGDTEPPPIARKNRIGGLLKDAPTSGLKNLSESVGGAVKRPLSGIFRRPGSRGGSRPKEKEDAPASATTTESAALKVTSTTEVRSMSPAHKFNAAVEQQDSRRSSAREDYDQVSATAPHLTARQLHGLLQVDELSSKHPHLGKLDDIDISLLSRFIASEEEVADEREAWTWDTIFTSTSSEMRQEWSQDDDSGDEDGAGGGMMRGGPGPAPYISYPNGLQIAKEPQVVVSMRKKKEEQ